MRLRSNNLYLSLNILQKLKTSGKKFQKVECFLAMSDKIESNFRGCKFQNFTREHTPGLPFILVRMVLVGLALYV